MDEVIKSEWDVAWLFRSKNRGQHSIENLFASLKTAIPYAREYYMPSERYNSIKNLLSIIWYTKGIKADLYHITGEIYFVGAVLPKNKFIITMHDFGGLDNMRGIKKGVFSFLGFYIPFSRCSYIVCISQHVCEDVKRRFPKFSEKVICINDPISNRYIGEDKLFNKDSPVILIVGTGKSKNLPRIVEAVKGMKCKLDIVGNLSEELQMKMRENRTHFSISVNISEDELIKKYSECDIVCFPSIHEGFGMPVIEGQRMKRAVLTSNIEPLMEVSGGDKCACIVDPFEADSISAGLKKIISDDIFRQQIIKNGYQNSLKYTPENISKEYEKVYKNVLEGVR